MKELDKMVKKNLIEVLNDNTGRYTVHPDFKEFFEAIDLDNIRPYPKKINDSMLKGLRLIAILGTKVYGKELDFQTALITQTMINEGLSQQEIKNLYAAGYIEIYQTKNQGGEIIFEPVIAKHRVYSSEYETTENLYKSQLRDYMDITQEGIEYLESKGIYTFYTEKNISNIDNSTERKEIQQLIKPYDKEVKREIFNNNKEVLYILKSSSIMKEHDFLKAIRKGEIDKEIKDKILFSDRLKRFH